MPVSKFMPYSWYDTPNIHFCTILDFEQLCRDLGISIVERVVVDEQGNSDWLTRYLPNIFGTTAIYRIKR
jgi:methionine biosynthesis protein MetW